MKISEMMMVKGILNQKEEKIIMKYYFLSPSDGKQCGEKKAWKMERKYFFCS